MTTVGIILASIRPGRRGEAFAQWIAGLIGARPDVKTELIDLREWPIASYDFAKPPTMAEVDFAAGSLDQRWAEKIRSLDAVVIVTPEYTHGYPGHLKSALDRLYAPWNHKPVAFVTYGGFASGARAAEQLTPVAVELRMVPVRDQVNIRLIGLAADERGFPTDDFSMKRAAAMIDELLWLSRVLAHGRTGIPR